MRKPLAIAGLLLLPMLAGCTASEALFGVFGDHYSGGGYTRADREHHFQRQIGTSHDPEPWNR